MLINKKENIMGVYDAIRAGNRVINFLNSNKDKIDIGKPKNKMKLMIIVLLISAISFAQIPYDKQLHFAAGIGIAIPARVVSYDISDNNRGAWIWSMGLVTGIGIAKEIKDEIDYGGFDYKDLAFTILGGLVVNATIEVLREKHKKKRR